MYKLDNYNTSIEMDELEAKYHESNPLIKEHAELKKLREEGYEIQLNEDDSIKIINDDNELITEDLVYLETNISIHVDPKENSNYKYDPYIKVYNGPYKTATKVVRIYLRDAGLDYSHKDRGKHFDKLSMTISLARQLNDIMDIRLEKTYINKYGREKTRQISVYGYIWAIIQNHCPDAEYINKPNFTRFYIRKE